MSLLGLVRHMAEGKHQWFRIVLGGEKSITPTTPTRDADFDDVDDVAEAFTTCRNGHPDLLRERIGGVVGA